MSMKRIDVFLIVFTQFIHVTRNRVLLMVSLRRGLKLKKNLIKILYPHMSNLQSYFTCHIKFTLTFVLVLRPTVHVQSF